MSVFAGVASMAVIIPFNAYMAAISQKLQKKRMEFKDERVKYVTEVLHGIKVGRYMFKIYLSKIRKTSVSPALSRNIELTIPTAYSTLLCRYFPFFKNWKPKNLFPK